jgi:hypothetical protein
LRGHHFNSGRRRVKSRPKLVSIVTAPQATGICTCPSALAPTAPAVFLAYR